MVDFRPAKGGSLGGWKLAAKEWIRPFYLRYFYFPLAESNCPPAFRAPWDFPSYPLDSVSGEAGPPGPKRPVIFLPMADWHGTFQRTQQLALALARNGHSCLYVNPHLGRQFERPYLFSTGTRIGLLDERIAELHVHLPREPVYHHRRLSAAEARRAAGAVRTAADRLGLRNPLLFASFPLWGPVVRELRETNGYGALYDCHDLLSDFPGVAAELAEDEAACMRQSDGIIYSSKWLEEHWTASEPSFAGRGRVIQNGVAPADYSEAASSRHERSRERPVIGYIGAMSTWFDTELVESVVRARPDWRFQFIGDIADKGILGLRRHSNVTVEGPVPYSQLPRYMREFSVGIIPFQVSQLTLAVDPLKLYEYLSAGLPVVSTPLPEVAARGSVVSIAASAEQFIDAIETAMRNDGPEEQALRARFVTGHTWHRRAMDLMEFAQEMEGTRAVSVSQPAV